MEGEINQDGFTVYTLNGDECRSLFKVKEEAIKNTFPIRNEGFAVALMTKSGNIYNGASYKSDTGNLTMHSEASALAHAANHGETEIVAITGPNCHACKQLIWESSIRSKIDTAIIINEGDKILQVPVSTLMPYPWPDKDMKK